MKPFTNDFIFSSKYRLWRHILFWFVFTLFTSLIYVNYSRGMWSLQRQMFTGTLWLPARILYCYPLMYWVIPKYLLKGKYVQFAIIIVIWFIGGWFFNYLFRVCYPCIFIWTNNCIMPWGGNLWFGRSKKLPFIK